MNSQNKERKRTSPAIILIPAVIAVIVIGVLILSAMPSAEDKWQEQYDLGQKYLLEQDYEQAIVAFTAAIEIDPTIPDAYMGRAEAYIGGDIAAASTDSLYLALADYETAAGLDETLTDAWVGLGDISVILGTYANLTDAVTYYSTALSLDDTLTEVYISRGDTYSSLGSMSSGSAKSASFLSSAIADYEAALLLDGTRTDIYLKEASVYLLLEDYEQAADVCTKAIGSGIEDVGVYLLRAEAYYNLALLEIEAAGDEDAQQELPDSAQEYLRSALEDYMTALSLGDDSEDTYRSIAEIYILLGDYDSALDTYMTALSPGVDSEDIYLDIAEIYILLGDYDSALDTYLTALSLGMDSEETYCSIAEIYILLGDYDSALDTYMTALSLGMDSEETYCSIAEIYILLGDYDSAMEILEQGAEEYPDSTVIAEEALSLTAQMEELEAQAAQEELMDLIRENWLDDLIELAQSYEENVLALEAQATNTLLSDELTELLTEQEDALLFELEEEDGYYLGIYHYGDGIYYGEMEDGVRSGYGVWIKSESVKGEDDFHLKGYVGEWADDVPNGSGYYQSYSDRNAYFRDAYGFIIDFVDGEMDGEGIYYERLNGTVTRYNIEMEDGILVDADADCPYSVGYRLSSIKVYSTSY